MHDVRMSSLDSAAAIGPRILMVTSEAYPLAKTGGLADVLGALPNALREIGADVRILLPGYESVLDALREKQVVATPGELCGVPNIRLIAGTTPDTGLPVWVVDCPSLYLRAGSPYQDASGEDWPDNWLRFGVLGHVAAWCASADRGLGWQPEIVHGHDWQAGIAPLLLRQGNGAARVHTVFTVHNAAFQGNFDLDVGTRLAVPQHRLRAEGVEFYGKLSFLKAGILFSDRLTTVSPRYAREICTPEFGCGMEGLYASRNGELVGILNGIDTATWDPARDAHLAAPFGIEGHAGKRHNKARLQQEFRLTEAPRHPLLAYVARLTTQKMADAVLDRLPAMLNRHADLQCVVLGRGERVFEEGFRRLAPHLPGRLGVHIGYSEPLAHRIQAGADVFVHGARFEPCGLTQMHAMRYGTVPVVRAVGGLAETVTDIDDRAAGRPPTGFVFADATAEALEAAVDRCLQVYREAPDTWRALQANGMRFDSGWGRSARAYLDLYRSVLGPPQR
jgi:starch synthase